MRSKSLLAVLVLAGCSTAAVGVLELTIDAVSEWPKVEVQTAEGCYNEEAGLAPETPECHQYRGPWPACDAPDPQHDIYETCAGNVLTETNPDTPNTYHPHNGGHGHPYQINCTTYCDNKNGWDGCWYTGECLTQDVACQGGQRAAGYCSCSPVLPCYQICCVINFDYWYWMTPEACDANGGENLGQTEDCFGANPPGEPPPNVIRVPREAVVHDDVAEDPPGGGDGDGGGGGGGPSPGLEHQP